MTDKTDLREQNGNFTTDSQELSREYQNAWKEARNKLYKETRESRLMYKIINSPENPFNQ